MREIRVALLSLLLFCLSGLTQARSLTQSPYPGYADLFKRQSNIEEPRCPPKGSVSQGGTVRDDYNVPESTEEQILNGNLAAYAQFLKGEGQFAKLGESDTAAESDLTERSSGNETWIEKLGKTIQPRANGQGRARHETALFKVQTDRADAVAYANVGNAGGPVLNRVISTDDLCGCTVLIVSSPFATILLHVWERRAAGFDFQGPNSFDGGPAQEFMDQQFNDRGRDLLMEMLRRFGTKPAQWRTWFPLETTIVTVVAPAANPDYVDWEFWMGPEQAPFIGNFEVTEQVWRAFGLGDPPAGFQPFSMPLQQNPVSTHPIVAGDENRLRLIYPNAASKLLDTVSGIMNPGRTQQSQIVTYRRRYANDPLHRTDDRQYIAVAPFLTSQGTMVTILYYDDDKALILNRL